MGVQNILGYFVWGYNFLGGTKYPVTPAVTIVTVVSTLGKHGEVMNIRLSAIAKDHRTTARQVLCREGSRY